MRKANKTKIAVVRLPQDLIEHIEQLIEETKIFVHKPDFIISGIRYAFDRIDDEMSLITPGLQQFDHGCISSIKDKLTDIWEDVEEDYRRYDGDPVQVNLRLPIGLLRRWQEYQGLCFEVRNFQDFVRYSTTVYCGYIEDSQIMTKSFLDLKTKNRYSDDERRKYYSWWLTAMAKRGRISWYDQESFDEFQERFNCESGRSDDDDEDE